MRAGRPRSDSEAPSFGCSVVGRAVPASRMKGGNGSLGGLAPPRGGGELVRWGKRLEIMGKSRVFCDFWHGEAHEDVRPAGGEREGKRAGADSLAGFA